MPDLLIELFSEEIPARMQPKAAADLRGIWNYTVERWGTKQAEVYSNDLERAFKMLVDNPDLGRSYGHVRVGYRVYPCGKHLIVFRSMRYGVEIVRVLHERMDVPRHL